MINKRDKLWNSGLELLGVDLNFPLTERNSSLAWGQCFLNSNDRNHKKDMVALECGSFEILPLPLEFKETVLSWPLSSPWKRCSCSQNLFLKNTAHERKYPLPGALLRMRIWLDCVIPLCLCVASASNLDYLPFRERAHSSCRIPLLWVRTDVIHFLLGCVRRSAWDKSVFWMR